MNGLVFSALALLCVLIPGLVFQFRYYKAATDWDCGGNVDIGSVRALILAVLISAPVHAVWIGTIALINRLGLPLGNVDFTVLMPLLRGQELPNGAEFYRQLDWLEILKTSAYIVTQTGACFFAGSTTANIVAKNGWSKTVALSSKGSIWHKSLGFPDGDPAGILVSATVTLGGTTFLYYGLLDRYELTELGGLRYLVLLGAMRREIGAANKKTPPYEMPGEQFVLVCDNIQTVDIDYFWIEDSTDLKVEE